MKILFVCTSIDKELTNVVEALKLFNFEVDILDILSYEFLYSSGKKISIRPKTKFKVFEYFFMLDEINEYHRRREIFDYLDRYDIVHVYKAEYFAKNLLDKIELISLQYIITPSSKILKRSHKIDELFLNAKGILFFNHFDMKKFLNLNTFGVKSRSFYPPKLYFEKFDTLKRSLIEKLLKELEIDEDRVNVYCRFSGSKLKQKELLIKLVNLSYEIKKETTFMLHLKCEDDDFNKRVIMFLKDMKLDFVLLNKSVKDEQVLMILKIAKASIFTDFSIDDEIFLTSLYAKNHPFLFEPKGIIDDFKENKIFLDNFEQFKFFYQKDEINEGLYREIFNKNKQQVKKLFHPKIFAEEYIKFVVE